MKTRTFLRLVATASVGLACSRAMADDAKKAKPATPPPKKKAEREAEEDAAPEPESRQTGEESFNVLTALLGLWRTSAPEGPRQLVIKARGLYVLEAQGTETGVMMAQLGIYRRRPDKTKQWAEGTYKFHSIDEIETDGPFGKLVWTRAK